MRSLRAHVLNKKEDMQPHLAAVSAAATATAAAAAWQAESSSGQPVILASAVEFDLHGQRRPYRRRALASAEQRRRASEEQTETASLWPRIIVSQRTILSARQVEANLHTVVILVDVDHGARRATLLVRVPLHVRIHLCVCGSQHD